MRTILTIFKKEIMRFLTDRRMLITLLMPGLLIYIIYSLLGSFVNGVTAPSVDTSYVVYVQNQPSAKEYAFDKVEGMNIIKIPANTESTEELREKVNAGEAHLVVIYEKNFDAKMKAYSIDSGEKAPTVELYYNSTFMESAVVYDYYRSCLEAFEQSLCNKFDVNSGDVASAVDETTYLLKMILPMLLVTLIYSGCMTVTTESVAGEKERGTIATLLVTPVKRRHLVLGKVFALSCLALLSGTSSFIGLISSLPTLLGVELAAVPYALTDYIAILAVVLVTVLLFTVLLMIISTFAKSVKEATGFAGPMVIVMVLLSLATTIFPVTSLAGYFVPFFNIVLCLTSIVSLDFNAAGFLITILVDLAVFAAGIFAMVKMFDSEKVMFSK